MVNPLAAALGPVGGLAACACCLLIAAIWGLFATTIALAVYTSKQRLWLRSLFFKTFFFSLQRIGEMLSVAMMMMTMELYRCF